VVWLSLPPTVIVFNDDFGYLRSILETLQHRRPWTDDWLEPWAASLSVFSALVFSLTGSFRAATYGLQAVSVGITAALSIHLLQSRKMSLFPAIAWSLVFVSFPTMLWKIAEFGAVPLYAACLLAAICFARQRRWLWFGVVWFIALLSRQSALLWLALPAGMLLESSKGWREWRATIAKLAAIGLGGALVYLGTQSVMNRTNAQAVMTPNIRSLQMPVFLPHAALALAIFLAAAGAGALCSRP